MNTRKEELIRFIKSEPVITSLQFINNALASDLTPQQRLILLVLVHYRTSKGVFPLASDLPALTGMTPRVICKLIESEFGVKYISKVACEDSDDFSVWAESDDGIILYGYEIDVFNEVAKNR